MLLVSTVPGDLVFLTWLPETTTRTTTPMIRNAYEEIRRYLADDNAEILQERIFGSLDASQATMTERALVFGDDHGTLVDPTFIEGRPCFGGPLSGIHVIAARPASSSELISRDGAHCGRRIDGAEAAYLGLSDVSRSLNPTMATPGGEARDTLLLASRILDAEGWSFTEVCRTWFYLDDILSWYDDFNAARNSVFRDLGLLNGSSPGMIPASTGIRGRNPRGHHCTLDLIAVRPIDQHRLTVESLHNPLQNEAPEYGSAFSRGLTVATESCRTFFVSGTASIDEAGATVHAGDFERQTRRTLDNIESLLASRGAAMESICQGTIFVKRSGDIQRMNAILGARGLADLPFICTVDDVCRDDLLVEVDATAQIPLPTTDNG